MQAILTTVLATFFSMFFLSGPVLAQTADYPEITFEYADLFDAFCADATKKPIDPGAAEELQARLGAFREHWRNEAPQLLGSVVELTKAPFRFGEAKAALSFCLPGSLNFPLIINVRHYMKSINGERVRPLENFAAAVFHETLHRYVNDRLPAKTSRLLTKYRDEPAPVRNHIHLFAIFEEVYRKLGREKQLSRIIASAEHPAGAAIFKRAREIIKIEGTENVICEISRDGCGARPDTR